MLEEILLFLSTYSKQLLLDATLIGSTGPIQPCRDGKSHLCSFQDTHHWQSKPSEYRQCPPPPAHPTGRVPSWDWCFSWDSGMESLGGPCAKGFTPVKMTPNSQGKSAGGQRCPETACPTMSSGLQEVTVPPKLRGPCRRWGGHPSAHVFLPAVPAWPGERQVFILPPCPSHWRWLRGNLEPGKRSTGLGWAMELLPPPPYHHPAQGKGGAAAALHLRYTPNIPKQECHNNLSSQGGTKPALGGSRSIPPALRARRARHATAGPGLKSARTAGSTPPSPPQTAPRHKDRRPAHRPGKVQWESASKRHQPFWKGS